MGRLQQGSEPRADHDAHLVWSSRRRIVHMSADRAALIQPGWGCGPERPLAWPSTTSTGGPGMGAVPHHAKAGHR